MTLTRRRLIELAQRYYDALFAGSVDGVMELYDSAAATVEDPVGTPVLDSAWKIRAFYEAVLAPTHSVRLTGHDFFCAPSSGTVSVRVTSSTLDLQAQRRRLLRANQEFHFDPETERISAMRAVWDLEAYCKTALRTALVTGGASGLGLEIAGRLSRDEFQVVIADVLPEAEGRAVAVPLHAAYLRCDVGDPSQVEAAVSFVVDRFGRLDAAVANAGILGVLAPTHLYKEDAWARVVNTNLSGVFRTMKYAARAMVAQEPPGGVIVSTSSIRGMMGFPYHAAYTAAKGGIISLTRSMAVEYGDKNIRVVAVAPGTAKTNLHDEVRGYALKDLPAQKEDAMAHNLPLQGMVTPEGVAGTVAWLVSDDASCITGLTVPVDRGYVAAGYQSRAPPPLSKL